MKQMPHTPFSLPLSRSARETRLRILNIAAGPKKRPPVLFLALVFSLCLLCGNLVSCRTQAAEELDRSGQDPAPEADRQARAAYAQVLEDMLWNGVLPDGTDAQSGPMYNNTFAIADVDGDGREELVVCFTTASTAGQRGWVLDYDADAGTVRVQYEGSTSLTFYSNGALAEGDSHAQGSWTSDFWPYTLYTYQPETDSYQPAGHVDAWEKSVSDDNPENLPPFPGEKDTSGAGILYYIQPAEYLWPNSSEGYVREPVDQSVYLDWLEPLLGDAQPLTLNHLPLTSASIPLAESQAVQASDVHPGLDRTPDLNGNGIPETFQLDELADGSLELGVWENGQRIRTESGDTAWNRTALFLCTREGKDYLLRYHTDETQGSFAYSYALIDLTGEFEEWAQSGSVAFDINFGTPYHKAFDRPAIAAFLKEINGLLAQSVLLFNTYPGLAESFDRNGRLYDDLSWMDACEGFSRDQGKSLLDNLEALQRALMARQKVVVSTPGALPIAHPVELRFSSGVGAWQTVLTLNPDGSFTGDYCDADMEVQYVCQFHGTFGDVEKWSDTAYVLTLKELTLDTRYPVGKEWDEGGFHYVSSQPYGLDGADGKALQPGAAFVFYTPEAAGHQPGTDLYGAVDFQSWMPQRQTFGTASDTLGCYGLHNLEMGYGFFS